MNLRKEMWPYRRERSELQTVAPVPTPALQAPATAPAEVPIRVQASAQAPAGGQAEAPSQTKPLPPTHQSSRRLRSACDSCHHAKMRCSGGVPCTSCADSKQQCSYSVPNRIGRPKGTKNKKTLSQLSQIQARRHTSTQTEPRRASTDLRPGRPAVTAVDVPQRALSLSTRGGHSTFEPLVESTPGDSQNVSYPLANSDPSCWDSITYEFVADMALDGEGKGTKSVALSTERTTQASRRCTSDCLTPFDDMTVDSGSGEPHHLSYTTSTSNSSCWDSISYDFAGDMSLSGGVMTPSAENPYTTRPPSEELPNSLREIEAPMRTSTNNALPWNNTASPEQSNTRRHSPPRRDPQSHSPTTCSCLQDHAELLCRLKDLDRRNAPPSVDTILVGTKQSLEPWKRLIKCGICRRNDDQEVLLIAAMTMRTLLQRFLGLYSTRSNSRGTMGDSGPRKHRVQLPEDEVEFTVGIYQVVGQEQILVTDMLLWNMLGRIKCALACLRERLDYSQMQRRIAAPTLEIQSQGSHESGELDFESNTDTGHLQQMMHGFAAQVRVLENILRENKRIARDL